MGFLRRRRPPLTLAELIERKVDADLVHVQAHRMTLEDRRGFTVKFVSDAGEMSKLLVFSFLAGYDWGENAEAFMRTNEEMRNLITVAASAYVEQHDFSEFLSASSGHPVSSGGFGAAMALRDPFRGVLPLAQERLLLNGDKTGWISIDDGFDAWIASQEIEDADTAHIPQARGFFHCGVVFFAFETQVLLEVRSSTFWEAYKRLRGETIQPQPPE